MVSDERTEAVKVGYFTLFVIVNGVSGVVIPFALDYAHTFLNAYLIPDRLRWDDYHHLRVNPAGWFLAQVLLVGIEFSGLLWLLYRFNRRSMPGWLIRKLLPVSSVVNGLVVAGVALMTVFGRGSFLIWLVKRYLNASV